MMSRDSAIFLILIVVVQLCASQIYPETYTIPVVSDEHGNLCFGDPFVHNETTQEQSLTQSTDKTPLYADLFQELDDALPPLHVSQPQAVKTRFMENDVESFLTDLSQPVYTSMLKVEVDHNREDTDTEQQEVHFAISQETKGTDTDAESVDTDLGTLLDCGDLGPLSVDGISIEPLSVAIEMGILPNDTTEERNTNSNMACPEFNGSTSRKSVRNVQINYNQSLRQFTFCKNHFANQTHEKPSHSYMYQKQPRTTSGPQKVQRNSVSDQLFQPDVCPKLSLSSNMCQTHRQIHTSGKKFQCDLCSKQFRTSSNYQKHRRIHTGEKPFKCDFCQKEFSDPSSYRRHRRIHTGEKPFQCDFCRKKFSDPSGYQKHRHTHSVQKPFQCEICSMQFRILNSYDSHRQKHAAEKPFRCDFCPKEFNDLNSCQIHRRIHTDEKPFHCDVCGKQFRTSSNCRAHRRTHSGEKPFQCNVCGKNFRTSADCQNHRRRIHTREKPFKCDFCQKEFSDSGSCQRHRRKHIDEKPFQCDICPKRFRTSGNYQAHRRTHTGEKPFKCNFCQKEFSDPSNCQRHKRIHIGEKPLQCDVCCK